MFENMNELIEKKSKDSLAMRNVMSSMLDSALKSDMPDDKKITLMVMKNGNAVRDNVEELIKKYCLLGDEQSIEDRTKVAEYLGMVLVGIEQFMETLPADNKKE